VSRVKIYACRHCTINSKNVRAIPNANENGLNNYMMHDSHLIMKLFSPFSFAFGIALTFFEFMVQCLQAYIFTLLTALYIAGALADEH